MPRFFLTATSAVLLVVGGSAQAKRDWQDGTWRDTERISIATGTVHNGTLTGNTYSGSTTTVRKVYRRYAVEGA